MAKSRTASRTRKPVSIELSVKVPPMKERERFLITYELEGCQKAVNFLTNYYSVRRMYIILNGRMVGKNKSNHCIACYNQNKAYFTKEGLKKRIALHELYHHLIEKKHIEIPLTLEEKEANAYARRFLHY